MQREMVPQIVIGLWKGLQWLNKEPETCTVKANSPHKGVLHSAKQQLISSYALVKFLITPYSFIILIQKRLRALFYQSY